MANPKGLLPPSSNPPNPSTPGGNPLNAAYNLGNAVATRYNYQYFNYANLTSIPVSEEPPKELETINTKECLVGYRAWRVQKLDGKYYLQSTYKDTVWPHREKLERGTWRSLPDYTPTIYDPSGAVQRKIDDLSKGIHAVKEKHKLGELCVNYEESRVCGTINMWGEITETEHGYLAQYAYPKELWVMSDMDPTVIMELEENYGVPVQVSEGVEMAYKSSLDWRQKNSELYNQVITAQRQEFSNPYPWAAAVWPDSADAARIAELEEKLAKAENALAEIAKPRKPRFWEKWRGK